MNAGTAGGLLRAWYFATPAFLLLDVFAGAPIRVAALPEGTPPLSRVPGP